MFACFTVLLACIAAVLAECRTSPPKGALIVGKGYHATIQEAVDALESTHREQVIFIYPGIYYEQVTIKSLSGPLTIYGYSKDTSSHAANQVTIIAGHSKKDRPRIESTATLRAQTSDFRLYNVNVVNSFGQGSQALALSASEPNQGYYACSFRGIQDTVLAESGAQLFVNCYIEGATDFVFGQKANAWFESCTIGVLPSPIGYITASGPSHDSPGYYVFNRATIDAAVNTTVKAGVYYLGRPWRAYARVVFQCSHMSHVVNSAGWHIWHVGDERIDHVSFGEFANTGPGAAGKRANFSKTLKHGLEMCDVLGKHYKSAYYFDSSFLQR